jgi:hypothetical protein
MLHRPGNDYRLVAAVDFENAIVWIKWIGTHKDYDKIDVSEVRHERRGEANPFEAGLRIRAQGSGAPVGRQIRDP